MKYTHLISLLVLCAFFNCSKENEQNFKQLSENSPNIAGKTAYLNSSYVTAGNRVYMVGHQDGSFPDLGWHIKGEMGGIWNHPIKLMDGFDIEIIDNLDTLKLNKAKQFVNYPFTNKHTFSWDEKDLEIERWQFVPDDKQGIVIQLVIKNNGGKKNINLKFTGHTDLRPTWLGERTNMFDGKDEATYDDKNQIWKVKDSLNPWYTVFGSQLDFESTPKTENYATQNNTSANSLESTIVLSSGKTHVINYVIAGSYTSESDALNTYQSISDHIISDFTSKRERYKKLAEKSKLTIPDKNIEQAFEWLKYNSDWLIRTVPEIGTGITAGIPDYPWWFGVDSEYALKGYMAIGQKEAVYSTIKLLDSVSNAVNGNGKIIHEMSSNGAVFNPGNINETPQFASLIWEVYKWNGEKSFLETYYPTIVKGLDWLMQANDDNKNLFPDGFGMMEIHGMDSEMIDVAVYTQRAFVDASKIATELNDAANASKFEELAYTLKAKINNEFWSAEFNSYADFIGTDEQALHLIDDAIVRADTLNKPWAVEELKATKSKILANPSAELKPFVLHHNWVVNTPMEMGIADTDKAKKALKTAENFVNPFGVFVTGIDRDETAGTDEGSFKGSKQFSYTGAVMTLPTSVLIIAENNYENPDKALDYLKRMTKSFSYAFPGSMYEVSPDYGMITQAWNIYGYAVPIIQQFFGINPMASQQKVIIEPQMPTSWNDASIENVEVADNNLSVFYHKTEYGLDFNVQQTNTNWTLEIKLPISVFKNHNVNSDAIDVTETKTHFVFTGKEQELKITLTK
ncbi:glycogen debranching protein [Sabulilitoribacter multivorans]|uniref:Glycogen debranching protein n=1 Tax=Flaviramulus multivorans TaxID=1304750 RepID=A0ABS9IIL6_9FLAO|nr:glycogen debranching protein [Flaviramulus multivorans]MCF7560228.1 glycogen debranching protein [Flaviramulus multivorans]